MAHGTPHQRLRAAREHAGFTDMKEACERHGWPYETYKKHETDPTRRIDPDMVPNYARAYDVNPEWILWGGEPP